MIEEWEQGYYNESYKSGDLVYFEERIYECTDEFCFHSPFLHPEEWRLVIEADIRKNKVIENNTQKKSIRGLVDNIVYNKPNKIVVPDDWDEF